MKTYAERLRLYEAEKKEIEAKAKTYQEYERLIREAARKLKI